MLKVTPNFHFRGQGREAIELYKRAFGAEVRKLICDTAAGNHGLVYHAEISIGGQRITLTDAPDDPAPCGNILSLLITFETAEEVKRAYEVVIDGGRIIYPMQRTDYSSCFVSLVDKFGARWELMTEDGG